MTYSQVNAMRDNLEYALDCVLCFCGNHKRVGKPFCFQCFDLLPYNWQHIMRPVYNGDFYPDIIHEYAAACDWLRKHYSARFPGPDNAPLS